MSILERPRLRPNLAVARDTDSRYVYLSDPLRLSRDHRLSMQELAWVQFFDGSHAHPDIQAKTGQPVPPDSFAALVRRLDEAMILDGPCFRDFLASPIREPSCIGCYSADPDELRRQMRGLFTAPGGPGLPAEPRPDGRLRAALVPHIDYPRGGVSYGWGFKEVFERTDARLFVIIGTSHLSYHRFTLTRKHFKTPLGIVPTDQEYIDRLVKHYGPGLFDDEACQVPEWSIELEVVLLQYLYEGRAPFRIVPLVVGSFADCVRSNVTPSRRNDIGRMIEALRRAEAETAEPICYIISGDLAHIGPKFRDPVPVYDLWLNRSRAQDEAILRQAEKGDADGYYRVIANEGDSRRICGLPPTYTVLEAVRPASGKVLNYGRYVHPQGHESVSFASVAFYR